MWKDPYFIAREKLDQDLDGLLRGKYGARVIEVLPSVFDREDINFERTAENAYAGNVQNQLLFLLKVTQKLSIQPSKFNIGITYLEQRIDKEDQWLGGEELCRLLKEDFKSIMLYKDMWKQRRASLMKACHVFGGYPENSFREQWELYQDGPATL